MNKRDCEQRRVMTYVCHVEVRSVGGSIDQSLTATKAMPEAWQSNSDNHLRQGHGDSRPEQRQDGSMLKKKQLTPTATLNECMTMPVTLRVTEEH